MQKPDCSGEDLKMSLVPHIFLFIAVEWGVVHPELHMMVTAIYENLFSSKFVNIKLLW